MGFVKKVAQAFIGGQSKGLSGAALGQDVMKTVTGNPAATGAVAAPAASALTPAATAAAQAPAAAAQTPAQIAEEERKRKLLQVNAGATQGNITGSNGVVGAADTTRKMLLGL